jgi:hypothetical protein
VNEELSNNAFERSELDALYQIAISLKQIKQTLSLMLELQNANSKVQL